MNLDLLQLQLILLDSKNQKILSAEKTKQTNIILLYTERKTNNNVLQWNNDSDWYFIKIKVNKKVKCNECIK